MSALLIRNVTERDAADLHAIYAHYVLHGFGTFEEVPPGVSSFDEKIRLIAAHGLPFLVAQSGDEVLGYTYASPFRPRTGYRYSVEDSVYVRDGHRGHGIGLKLLNALIPRCEACGVRQVVAVIGDSENRGSIAAHERAGFEHAGTVRGVGYKLGRWVDIVMMQLPLNGGTTTHPPARGAWT
ncbi:MAG: GNAT family N-acetyltransferase [Alphaproteobacteria bacterium]|nr:GNAT family N-acetyltransferase [Alphaproteobacteria bacterium]